MKCKNLINFIRSLYNTQEIIPLHEPFFDQEDKKRVSQTIDSTFVSSIGPLVGQLEKEICNFTGAKYAVAVVNGTSALHVALELAGVKTGDEVLTQSLTFVASTNAINQCNASPVFIDVSRTTLGMCSESLGNFLTKNCEIRDGTCFNKKSKKIIKACMPMHTFGFPCEVEEINSTCNDFNIKVIEDSAESLGSFYRGSHTGTFGSCGVISFNGNKIVTTGAGGMIITNSKELAEKAKHITTTARLQHRWNFDHDMPGYNYRMPNLNASLGLSQMEKLSLFLKDKKEIAQEYKKWGENNGYDIFWQSENSESNFWLNTLIATNKEQRDLILKETNDASIMTRPVWTPMHELPFNKSFQKSSLDNTNWLAERIVSLPSSVRKNVQ